MKPSILIIIGLVLTIFAGISRKKYRNLLKTIPNTAQSLGKKWGAKTDQYVLLRTMNSFFYIIGMVVTIIGIGITLNTTLLHAPTLEIRNKPIVSQVDENLSASDIFSLINQERKTRGLKELNIDNRLVGIAQDRLDDMVKNQYYAHLNPQGKYYYDLFPEYLIKSNYSCENLDVEFTTDPKVYVNDWLKSKKGHKECMLNKNVTTAGYAVGLFNKSDSTKVYLVVGIHTSPISGLSVPELNPNLKSQ